jgi:hypothetical protein
LSAAVNTGTHSASCWCRWTKPSGLHLKFCTQGSQAVFFLLFFVQLIVLLIMPSNLVYSTTNIILRSCLSFSGLLLGKGTGLFF